MEELFLIPHSANTKSDFCLEIDQAFGVDSISSNLKNDFSDNSIPSVLFASPDLSSPLSNVLSRFDVNSVFSKFDLANDTLRFPELSCSALNIFERFAPKIEPPYLDFRNNSLSPFSVISPLASNDSSIFGMKNENYFLGILNNNNPFITNLSLISNDLSTSFEVKNNITDLGFLNNNILSSTYSISNNLGIVDGLKHEFSALDVIKKSTTNALLSSSYLINPDYKISESLSTEYLNSLDVTLGKFSSNISFDSNNFIIGRIAESVNNFTPILSAIIIKNELPLSNSFKEKYFQHLSNIFFNNFIDEKSSDITFYLDKFRERILSKKKKIKGFFILLIKKGSFLFICKIKNTISKTQNLLSYIISPKLFHNYTVDDSDSNRVALNNFSFSNTSICQFREAVFHSINSKILIKNEIRFSGIN